MLLGKNNLNHDTCPLCPPKDGDNFVSKRDLRKLKRSRKRRERQAWLDDWDGEW